MNINISYDYDELLQELQEELDEGILAPTSKIQILRADRPAYGNYRPIIDWYYEDALTESTAQYMQDQPKLEQHTVASIMLEMKNQDRIVGDAD